MSDLAKFQCKFSFLICIGKIIKIDFTKLKGVKSLPEAAFQDKREKTLKRAKMRFCGFPKIH